MQRSPGDPGEGPKSPVADCSDGAPISSPTQSPPGSGHRRTSQNTPRRQHSDYFQSLLAFSEASCARIEGTETGLPGGEAYPCARTPVGIGAPGRTPALHSGDPVGHSVLGYMGNKLEIGNTSTGALGRGSLPTSPGVSFTVTPSNDPREPPVLRFESMEHFGRPQNPALRLRRPPLLEAGAPGPETPRAAVPQTAVRSDGAHVREGGSVSAHLPPVRISWHNMSSCRVKGVFDNFRNIPDVIKLREASKGHLMDGCLWWSTYPAYRNLPIPENWPVTRIKSNAKPLPFLRKMEKSFVWNWLMFVSRNGQVAAVPWEDSNRDELLVQGLQHFAFVSDGPFSGEGTPRSQGQGRTKRSCQQSTQSPPTSPGSPDEEDDSRHFKLRLANHVGRIIIPWKLLGPKWFRNNPGLPDFYGYGAEIHENLQEESLCISAGISQHSRALEKFIARTHEHDNTTIFEPFGVPCSLVVDRSKPYRFKFLFKDGLAKKPIVPLLVMVDPEVQREFLMANTPKAHGSLIRDAHPSEQTLSEEDQRGREEDCAPKQGPSRQLSMKICRPLFREVKFDEVPVEERWHFSRKVKSRKVRGTKVATASTIPTAPSRTLSTHPTAHHSQEHFPVGNCVSATNSISDIQSDLSSLKFRDEHLSPVRSPTSYAASGTTSPCLLSPLRSAPTQQVRGLYTNPYSSSRSSVRPMSSDSNSVTSGPSPPPRSPDDYLCHLPEQQQRQKQHEKALMSAIRRHAASEAVGRSPSPPVGGDLAATSISGVTPGGVRKPTVVRTTRHHHEMPGSSDGDMIGSREPAGDEEMRIACGEPTRRSARHAELEKDKVSRWLGSSLLEDMM